MAITQFDNSIILSLKEKSENLGFIAIGITQTKSPPFYNQFLEWISSGKQGGMHWLERHLEIRKNPEMLLEGYNSLISLAYPYSPSKPTTPDGFTIARYSEPKKMDYHDRLKDLAHELSRRLAKHFPKAKTRVCVDSAPILERSIAYAAGIGFIGKNNSLIVPGVGSYVFLAEILTTAHLGPADTAPIENQCGSCELCLKACPTGALEGPYALNAAKCLSYLTVEYKGEVDRSFGEKMGNCFLGCDVCQEVCPFNHKNAVGDIALPSTDEILIMEEKHFKKHLAKTALNRPGLNKIKSNIRLIQGLNRS